VTAEASPATAAGFDSADGWRIHFERFVTGVGDVRLHDAPDGPREACNDYAETHYEWLFDFTVVSANEKVGLAYGLGPCSVEFRFREPSDDTLLGPGVTSSDVAFMRARATDAYADDERAAVVAIGVAERGGVEKRFEWVFRRSYELRECPDETTGGYVSVRELVGGEAHTFAVQVRGEELFRRAPEDEAPFSFDRYAAADADADGRITLEELAEVEIPADDLGEGGAAAALEMPTLADLVYTTLLPRIARFAGGGACDAELRDRRR
jgi:hypothetical protein